MVGGQPVTISFGAGESVTHFTVSLSDAKLNVAGVLTIEGSVTFSEGASLTATDTTTLTGAEFAGTGLTIFFGSGPATLADGSPNPSAVGLQITNATVALFDGGSETNPSGYVLEASGTATLVGANGVTVTGQVTVSINTYTHAFATSLTLPGGSTAPLDVASGGGAVAGSASGTGLSISAGGQSFTGDVVLTVPQTGGLDVALSNVSLTLTAGGGNVNSRGPPIASLTNGSGEFVVSRAGAYGEVTGTVVFGFTGATLTPTVSTTFALQLNTTSAPQPITVPSPTTLPAGPYFELSDTGTLVVGSTTLSGTFDVTVAAANGSVVVSLTVSGGELKLQSGASTVLDLTAIAGSLTVSSAGIAGSLTATVASPGRTLSPTTSR